MASEKLAVICNVYATISHVNPQDPKPIRFLWWEKITIKSRCDGCSVFMEILWLGFGVISFSDWFNGIFLPKVSVMPSEFIDSKNPIASRFEVKNEGQLVIHDIYASSEWCPFRSQDENYIITPVGAGRDIEYFVTNQVIH